MKIVILPYGPAGWSARTRIVEEVLSSRTGRPFFYNDVLILVPANRMKRTYGRLFLDTIERLQGAQALVQPEVESLHQFFHHLYAKVAGPLLIDENSRLVLLEGVVKELIAGEPSFGKNPDILAPSLSASVAEMIEELSSAAITPERLSATVAGSDFSDKPQVRLLIDAYERYEQALAEKGILDPAGMLAVLAERFDLKWLTPYARIIIDGIHDADDLQTRLLRKIAAHSDCTFLVEAPSVESIMRSGEHHPLRITKEFLGGLGLPPVAASETMNPEDNFLSDILFSDMPFAQSAEKAPNHASFTKNINLLSAVNTREEVSLIAGKIKMSLRRGTTPDSILVAFPALDEYGPLAEEIFTDYGIPYNRALGRQLSVSAVTTAVISLLRACQEDYSGPSLIRIFSSPFLKFSGHPSIAPALNRFLRERRIIGGKHKLLALLSIKIPSEKSELLNFPPLTKGSEERFTTASSDQTSEFLQQALRDLFAALEPFDTQESARLSVWMERLTNLLVWSGLSERVAVIKGPLNINLQAYKKLNDALASLSRAGKLLPEYRYTFREWLFLLRKTFMHTRFQVPPEDEGGVQILGLDESIGHAWGEIYLGGLTDVSFPRRLPQNIFLPETTIETLGVRALERARMSAAFHFYRLLLSAPNVTLTYPENEGDRPVIPSPFLEELEPLKKAGLINTGVEKPSGIQFSLKIEDSHGIPELAKAISITEDENIEGLAELLNSNIVGLSGIKSAVNYQPSGSPPTIMPPQKSEFSVTELDLYIRCPYDYLVTRVLGLEPLEEVTEDISPMVRGSKVHAILRDFYLAWDRAVTKENRADARSLLGHLADSSFGQEADTFRNRREKELFLTVMAERFLHAEEEFWKRGMSPAYLEQKIERYRFVLANGREVGLSAKIDRIDVDENGNFIIVDYKTGHYPLPKINVDQDIFQLPVYAVMAQQSLLGKGPALKKPIGLAYYDLAGKTGASARDVVLFNKEAQHDHPSSKPKASPKSAEEFDEILKRSMDKARKAVEGILSGDFFSRPQDENKCRYCPNEMICEIEET